MNDDESPTNGTEMTGTLFDMWCATQGLSPHVPNLYAAWASSRDYFTELHTPKWVKGEPSKPGWFWVAHRDDAGKPSHARVEKVVIVQDEHGTRSVRIRDGHAELNGFGSDPWHCPVRRPPDEMVS